MQAALDYDKAIPLDAEGLAEGGIKQAYYSLLSQLRGFVPQPADIHEALNSDLPTYSVNCGGKTYAIYAPGLPNGEGHDWARAAHALFSIVNDQLTGSQYRLYSINGGNDLLGMFLTEAECESARHSL
jgi:hypothetical protein